MATLTWTGGTGNYFDRSNWNPAQRPHPGDSLTIASPGDDVQVGGFAWLPRLDIALGASWSAPSLTTPPADPATLSLGPFSAIGPHTSILAYDDSFTSVVSGAIDTTGPVANFGTIAASGNPQAAEITIDIGAGASPCRPGAFLNFGTLSTEHFGNIAVIGGPDARFVNDGTVDVAGYVEINATTLGHGTMKLEPPFLYKFPYLAGSSLEVNAPIGSGQTIDFSAGGSELTLDQPSTFDATISGFATRQPDPAFSPHGYIRLEGLDVTDVSYQGSDTAGTLTLDTAAGAAATLHFSGDYLSTAGSFTLTHNPSYAATYTDIGFTPA